MSEDKVVRLEPRHKSKRPGSDPVVSTGIEELGPHDQMTPQEVVDLVMRTDPTNLLVLHTYIDSNGDEAFACLASQMNNAEATYLIEKAKTKIVNA